ncbi:MAG: transposase [Thermoplasmataceae archaeon]
MANHRKWKAEEKLAVIKEFKEKGVVVETCRKYSVDPSMCYKWKESYDTFVLDGLK